MLKRADSAEPPRGSDRPIGEIVGQLVDDGKAYAQAEIDIAKAIAAAKARALVLPAALLGAAVLIALASLTALAIGLFFTLLAFVPALAAGLLTFLIFAAVAGLFGWLGINQLKAIL